MQAKEQQCSGTSFHEVLLSTRNGWLSSWSPQDLLSLYYRPGVFVKLENKQAIYCLSRLKLQSEP